MQLHENERINAEDHKGHIARPVHDGLSFIQQTPALNLLPGVRTRLEKAAADNGFDLALTFDGGWLAFASTHAPLRVWLSAVGDTVFLAAMSRPDVLDHLSDHGTAFTRPMPPGACGARGVTDHALLHRLLRRAFQLSRTLPDQLLTAFQEQTSGMPRCTEAERLIVQRVGQEVYRKGLLDYWDHRCAVTGLAVPELLRASHIKAWADCETDAERLDVFNGLLLAPNLDAAFDLRFITVADDGAVVVSALLDGVAREQLGLVGSMRVRRLTEGHRRYLIWHRARFRASASDTPSPLA